MSEENKPSKEMQTPIDVELEVLKTIVVAMQRITDQLTLRRAMQYLHDRFRPQDGGRYL